MQASGTPAPQTEPPNNPPPPPPPSAAGDPGKLSGGMRALAVVLAIVIAIAALFTGALAVVGADSVQCDDEAAVLEKLAENPGEDVTCYNSDVARVAAIGLGGIATIVLAVAALLALVVAIGGRRTRQALAARLVGTGVVLGALGYLVAAIDWASLPLDETADKQTPAAAGGAEPESTTGLRLLAGLLALALAFAAAVLTGLAIEVGGQPTSQAECRAEPGCTEYFDGSSSQRSATVALLGLGGGLGAIGVVVCLFVATTGGSSRLMLPVTGGAILFGAAGVIVANV